MVPAAGRNPGLAELEFLLTTAALTTILVGGTEMSVCACVRVCVRFLCRIAVCAVVAFEIHTKTHSGYSTICSNM